MPESTAAAVDSLWFRERIGGFLAGVASGITKLLVGHPFDTVRSGPSVCRSVPDNRLLPTTTTTTTTTTTADSL